MMFGVKTTRCSTIQWKERSTLSLCMSKCLLYDFLVEERSESCFSTLGFDLDSYYLPMSTGPKVVKPSGTMWISGSDVLISYMNSYYIPLQQNNIHNTTDQIIYQKKGNVGIATQLFGVCDILLLGIINDRLIQSRTIM